MDPISILIVAAAVAGFVAAVRHIRKNGHCGDCKNCRMKCGRK